MYKCESCNYVTDRVNNWNKHITTNKHLVKKERMNYNKSKKDKMNMVQPEKHVCIYCNREYKYKSGLSKHKNTCSEAIQNEGPSQEELIKTVTELKDYKNDISKTQTNQIEHLCNLLEKTITKNQEQIDQILPKIGNNVTNNFNKMTVNVFLNDYCKNAMNMSDFLEKVKFTVDDLCYTNENGYIKGITNIFVKSLFNLPIASRPIHCSDKKKMQFYVKDEDTWEIDREHQKIHKSIDTLTKKQVAAIKTWESTYPNWMEDSDLTSEYINMVKAITNVDSKSIDGICKDLSNKFYLDKEQLSTTSLPASVSASASNTKLLYGIGDIDDGVDYNDIDGNTNMIIDNK